MSFLPAHGKCNFRHFSLNLLPLLPHHCLSVPLSLFSVLLLWLGLLRPTPEVDCVHPEETGVRVGAREPFLSLTEQIQSGGGGRGSAEPWILHSCGEGLFSKSMKFILYTQKIQSISVSQSQIRYPLSIIPV